MQDTVNKTQICTRASKNTKTMKKVVCNLMQTSYCDDYVSYVIKIRHPFLKISRRTRPASEACSPERSALWRVVEGSACPAEVSLKRSCLHTFSLDWWVRCLAFPTDLLWGVRSGELWAGAKSLKFVSRWHTALNHHRPQTQASKCLLVKSPGA